MVQQPPQRFLSLLGLVYWGDIADLTLYKSQRGKLVSFLKTWPHVPGSPKQEVLRQTMRDAAKAWHALTPTDRSEWETASRRCSLCLTGYNLFVYWFFTLDEPVIRTIERQTDTVLLH
jgi:hypothetical protein